MAKKPKTIDDYLRALSADQRAALSKLRRDIAAAAPTGNECIAYGIPGLRVEGKYLVGFGTAAHHCAFYPGSIVQKFAHSLAGYDVGKGTIRFSAENPLPTSLVLKIVKARSAQLKRKS